MIIPMHFNGRSLQGPHVSCIMTSETYLARLSNKGHGLSRPTNNFYHYAPMSIGRKQASFNLYFTIGLITCVLFIMLVLLGSVYYLLANSFVRFQNKFMLLCIAFHVHIFDCRKFNRYLILSVRIMMLFVGGIGYLVTLFIKL